MACPGQTVLCKWAALRNLNHHGNRQRQAGGGPRQAAHLAEPNVQVLWRVHHLGSAAHLYSVRANGAASEGSCARRVGVSHRLAVGIALTGERTNTISREGLDDQIDTVCAFPVFCAAITPHTPMLPTALEDVGP